MILCLDCSKISPAGSKWCQFGCGSFGGVRCPKDHLSPASVGLACCTTCGSRELSAPARSLNLRPLSRVLAWAVSVGILCFVLSYGREIGGGLLSSACWIASHCLGLGSVSLVWLFDRLLAFLLLLWVGCKIVGKPFGPALLGVIRWSVRSVPKLCGGAFAIIYYLAEGKVRGGKKAKDEAP